jgi:hypothetical protein
VNKILLGLLLGALLGLFDGWTARFYDTVRPDEYTMIMGGSTFKGVVTGLAAGFAARKWNSIKAGLSAGLIVGLLFSAIIGYNEENGYDGKPGKPGAFWQIVLPGTALGIVVGIAAQRYGKSAAPA